MVSQRCPKCGGNLFLDNTDGIYLECLQCSKQVPLATNDPLIPRGLKPRFEPSASSAFQVHYGAKPSKNIKYQEG